MKITYKQKRKVPPKGFEPQSNFGFSLTRIEGRFIQTKQHQHLNLKHIALLALSSKFPLLHKTRPSTPISQTYHEIPLNNKENKVGKNPPLLFPKKSLKVQIYFLVDEK
jgi:hypothetical protein